MPQQRLRAAVDVAATVAMAAAVAVAVAVIVVRHLLLWLDELEISLLETTKLETSVL